jgi:hypothetical protein
MTVTPSAADGLPLAAWTALAGLLSGAALVLFLAYDRTVFLLATNCLFHP